MKRLCSFLLCFLLIASATSSALAASAVPESVINATDSVVRILSEYADGYATGSGFVIKSDKDETLIATNYHVVEGNPYSISIWLSEDETVSASILAHMNQKDMCILKLAYPVSLTPLSFAKNGAKQGEAVYAIGFPGAADYLSDKVAHTSTDATITDGIVSAVREATVSSYGTPTKILQINAAINSGNSGGPLFNANGEVVGINTYGINNAQGIFGAIDVSELKSFMTDYSIPIPYSTTNFSFSIPDILANFDFSQLSSVVVISIASGIVIFIAIIVIIVTRKNNKKKRKNSAKADIKSVSLRNYMAAYPDGLDMDEAVALLLPVALQLRDLHNNGIAHLQVSPNSIFIGTNGATLSDASSDEAGRYTNGFAAPEIYKDASAGNLSDIYSLCAVLYYVVSGMQPTNALSRTHNENEADVIAHIDAAFATLINTGMAINPSKRYDTMQEIIIKLSPYNTKPFENKSPVQQNIQTTKKKIRSKGRIFALIFCLLLIIAGSSGAYIWCYTAAQDYAQSGDFDTADQLLFLPQLTAQHDSDLIDYVDAGKMLTGRNYDAAKESFTKLKGYLNADELVKEADYRHAAQYADANNFEEAERLYIQLGNYKDAAQKALEVKYRKGTYVLLEEGDYEDAYSIFLGLSKKGYENADEMVDESRYHWAVALVEDKEYIAAFHKLEEIENHPNAGELKELLTEYLYLEGQELYRDGEYRKAKLNFDCVPTYSDSSKYITLIQARTLGGGSKTFIKELEKLFYFEDTPEVLLYNHNIAVKFLIGTWRSSSGYYSLQWADDGEWTYSNLPSVLGGSGYYTIQKGEILVYKDKINNAKLDLRLSLTSPNTLKVYCAATGETITLYR